MLRDGSLVSRRLVREMVRIACDRGDRTTVQRGRCHPPPRYINRDRSTEGSRGPPKSRSYDRRRRKLGRQASDRVHARHRRSRARCTLTRVVFTTTLGGSYVTIIPILRARKRRL